MKRNTHQRQRRDEELSRIVEDYWASQVGEDPKLDLRVLGATSLDLLGHELGLRRLTGLSISFESIVGPVTLESIIETTLTAPTAEAVFGGVFSDADMSEGGEKTAAATASQESQWLFERVRSTNGEYLIPLVVALPAGTTWLDLSKAVGALVERHPALRTSIRIGPEAEGESLVQSVGKPPGCLVLEARTIRDLEDDSIISLIDDLEGPVISVENERPWRAFGLCIDGSLRGFLWLLHHVAVDDTSVRLLVKGLADQLDSTSPESEADFAEKVSLSQVGLAQKTNDATRADLAWWRKQLVRDGVVPHLDLRSRGRCGVTARRIVAKVEIGTIADLDDRLRGREAVRSAAVLRAVARGARRIGLVQDTDVPIGLPVSVRDHPDLDQTVGMLLGTLPLPVSPAADLGELTRFVSEARRHRAATYESINREIDTGGTPVEGRSPWLDLVVGVVYEDRLARGPLDWRVAASGRSPFPIFVMARFETGGLTLELDYQSAWIGDRDAELLLAEIVQEIETTASGDDRSEDFALVGPTASPGSNRNLPELVRATADRVGEAAAIRIGDRSVSYRELIDQAEAVAFDLLDAVPARRIGEESPGAVAIVGGPSVDFGIAVLGAMMAGRAAMPIPMGTPPARMKRMLEVGRAVSVIVLESVPVRDVESALQETRIDLPVTTVAAAVEGPRAATGGPALPEIRPEDACYVLFTSGSSGEAKAVRMHHGGLAGLVEHERLRSDPALVMKTGQFAPIGFDVAFQELFTTWAVGGAVLPIPTEVRGDPFELARFIESECITRMHLPPLMLRSLASACASGFPESLGEIICAGEALRIDDAVRNAARSTGGGVRLINQYGPTETHVATHFDLGDDPDVWADLPSIGAPVHGATIRLETASGQPAMIGAAGEIVICGACVALGYQDGSSGGFEPDGVDGERRYRTGDQGRILPDGTLEFLGRLDGQLKISGYRVDPAEVESVIATMSGVIEVAVVGRRAESVMGSDAELIAFVVVDASGWVDEKARAELRRRLPAWMIPREFQKIDSLPRSANGKVDRAGLQRLAADSPRSVVESTGRVTAESVLEFIGGDAGTSESAFDASRSLGDLGIDSLRVIRLQAELIRRHGMRIPVVEILGASPLELRDRMTGERPQDTLEATETSVAEVDGKWTALDPIEREVLAEEATADPGAFHLAWRIRFPRALVESGIRKRFADVIERFPTLRTARDVKRGSLLLASEDVMDFDIVEKRAEPGANEIRGLIHRALPVDRGTPFRLYHWPSAEGGTEVLFVAHHVAVDGRVAESIIEGFISSEFEPGTSISGRASSPFREVGEDVDWWVERLKSGLESESMRIPPSSGEELVYTTSTAAALAHQRVERRVAQLGISRSVPGVVAWGLQLSAALGRPRVVIGLPFATSTDEAGFNTSVLPVVVDASPGRRIREIVLDVAESITGGLDHRAASLGSILTGFDPSSTWARAPFDGVVTVHDVIRDRDDVTITWEPSGRSNSSAGLVIPSSGEGSPVAMEVDVAVLEGEGIEAWQERFVKILEFIGRSVEADGSELTVEDHRRSTSTETGRSAGFGTLDASTGSRSVVARFMETAERHRDGIAVIDSTGEFTYAELDAWSEAIGLRLMGEVGDVVGRPVLVDGRRGAATIAAMLGIARAGGWFVSIDPDLPTRVRKRQIDIVDPVAVVRAIGAPVEPPGDLPTIDAVSRKDGPEDQRLPREIDPEGPLYAIFTSGTTGDPRGVLVPHRGIDCLTSDPWFIPADGDLRMLHASTLAFDASTLEIWTTILNGGTLSCWEGAGQDLAGMLAQLRSHRVNACFLTSALFHAAVDGLPEFFDGLGVVMTGGDVVSSEHVRRLRERRPDLTVINAYGPTENSVVATCEPLVRELGDEDRIPIGRPVRGTTVRIVDAFGFDAPIGRWGEIVLNGRGVALGYLDEEGGYRLRDGFGVADDSVDYHTGDRGRWRRDGCVEFGGRLDGQVKIAGRRIQMESVEAAIRRCRGVLDAGVSVVADGDSKQIVAVFVPEQGDAVAEDDILGQLRASIPDWEVPARLSVVESIPRTTSGKVDRKAIASIRSGDSDVGGGLRPELLREASEIVIASARKILDDDDIFGTTLITDLGADSLDLLQLAMELESRFHRPVTLAEILQASDIDGLVRGIVAGIKVEEQGTVALRPGSNAGDATFVCIPGIGGTVVSFHEIFERMESSVRAYGLPYPGLTGTVPPLRSIDAIADHFVSKINDEIGDVDFLVGYSLGGFVAFEVARRLARKGKSP
ncbi:MAG: AMP-binding protein, partial [Phycisphaeraceae bacterium]|nr:AMP-binding protein [Phycisphaeraceae bacterium]